MQLRPREMRIPIPFPRLAFVDGERRTPDWGFRVPLVPVKSHDDALPGEDLTGEEFTDVAVERTNFPAVESYRLAVGPINGPQPGFRIEQPQGKTLKGLALKFGREDVVITKAP